MPPKKKVNEDGYNTRVQNGNDILLSYYVTNDKNNIVCTIQRFINIISTLNPESISGFYGGFVNAKQNGISPAMSKKISYTIPGGGVISKSAYFNVLIPTDVGEMHYMPIVLGPLEIDNNGRIALNPINGMMSNVLIFNKNMFVYDKNGRRINDLGTFLQYKDQVTIYFHLLPFTAGNLILQEINNGLYANIGRNAYDDVTPYIYNIGELVPSRLANIIAEEMAMLADQNNNNLNNIDNQMNNNNNNNNADYVREDERDEAYTEMELPRIIRTEEDDIRSVLPIDPSDKKIVAILEDMKSGLYPDINPDDIPNDFIPDAPILDGRGILNAPPPVRPLNVPNLVYGARAIQDRAREAGELVRVADEIIRQNAELQAGLQQAINREQARALYRADVIARLQDVALINAQINYNRYVRQLALISTGCVVLTSYGVYLLYAYKGSYANIVIDTVYDWVNSLDNYDEYKRDYLELYRRDRPIQGPEYNELYNPDRPIQGPEYNELYNPDRPIQGPEYVQQLPSSKFEKNGDYREFLEDLYYYRKVIKPEQLSLVDPNKPYYGFEQQILNDLCDVIKVRIPEADLLLPSSIPIRYSDDQISTLPNASISVSQAYQSTAHIGNLLIYSASVVALNQSSEPGPERLDPSQLDHLLGPVTTQTLDYVGNAVLPLPPTSSVTVSPSIRPTPRLLNPMLAPYKVIYNKNEPLPTTTPLSPSPSPSPTPTPGGSGVILNQEEADKINNKSSQFRKYAGAGIALASTVASQGLAATGFVAGNVLLPGLGLAANIAWEAIKGTLNITSAVVSNMGSIIIAGLIALIGYTFYKSKR